MYTAKLSQSSNDTAGKSREDASSTKSKTDHTHVSYQLNSSRRFVLVGNRTQTGPSIFHHWTTKTRKLLCGDTDVRNDAGVCAITLAWLLTSSRTSSCCLGSANVKRFINGHSKNPWRAIIESSRWKKFSSLGYGLTPWCFLSQLSNFSQESYFLRAEFCHKNKIWNPNTFDIQEVPFTGQWPVVQKTGACACSLVCKQSAKGRGADTQLQDVSLQKSKGSGICHL